MSKYCKTVYLVHHFFALQLPWLVMAVITEET